MRARQLSCVIGTCITIGCTDAIIGSEPCDNELIECLALPLASDGRLAIDVTDVPVQDTPLLAPTWVKDLPTPAPDPNLEVQIYFARLVSDAEGNMYSFGVDMIGNGVRVSRLDEDGNTVQSTLLTAPEGALGPREGDVQAGHKITPVLPALFSSQRVPAIRIDWRKPCPNPDNAPGGTCWLSEQVFFPHGIESSPLRAATAWSLEESFLGSNGHQLYVSAPASDSVLTVKELAGDAVLWEQTDFSLEEYINLQAHGVALDDGRTVVAVTGRVDQSLQQGYLRAYLVGATGHVTELAGIDDLVEIYPHFLLSTGTAPIFVTSDYDGNLSVRVFDEKSYSLRGVRFERKANREMYPAAADVAPDGSVYVLTQLGSEAPQSQGICRASAAAESKCVRLPESFFVEDIVAQADGVVFARSQAQLLRLQFPH